MSASARIAAVISRAIAPRVPLSVSEWADSERFLSSKGSSEAGRWRTHRNPPLREPMDCMSARSRTRDVVLMFPIQYGKTEVALNVVGYGMDHNPGPIMVALPGEVSMNKWVAQKLQPMIDETPAVLRSMTSNASRNAANQRTFKDFAGGQLYLEHAGSPQRLKSTSVRDLIIDELDEFAASFPGGDDPVDMLAGRTSAFPATAKRLWISSPQILGTSRIHALYLKSDQRRYHVPCPHCDELQPLEWSGLQWSPGGEKAWYVCRECGAIIDEHHKTEMILRGKWIAGNPAAKIRGYTINCLYYQIGLGPRWAELAQQWIESQNDPARLKTFINDRLAEPWEDPTMRAVKHNVLADRAQPYHLRTAPAGALVLTVGIDTQDNRLAVHIVGWGRGMAAWTIDYVELPGDPADEAVWLSLVDLLGRPIQHETGALLRIEAGLIDIGGHRREAVKNFVRQGKVRRLIPGFGAVQNNAPVLNKGKHEDIDWRGRYDKNGITVYQVGTVGVKHMLFGRLSTDAEKAPESRLVHFSDQLPPEFFTGMVSETYNPSKNRFEKKRGARNEPLDTWGYAYAATHHPDLRLHRFNRADWDAVEQRLINAAAQAKSPGPVIEAPAAQPSPAVAQPAASRPAAADRHSSLLDRLRSRR